MSVSPGAHTHERAAPPDLGPAAVCLSVPQGATPMNHSRKGLCPSVGFFVEAETLFWLARPPHTAACCIQTLLRGLAPELEDWICVWPLHLGAGHISVPAASFNDPGLACHPCLPVSSSTTWSRTLRRVAQHWLRLRHHCILGFRSCGGTSPQWDGGRLSTISRRICWRRQALGAAADQQDDQRRRTARQMAGTLDGMQRG